MFQFYIVTERVDENAEDNDNKDNFGAWKFTEETHRITLTE